MIHSFNERVELAAWALISLVYSVAEVLALMWLVDEAFGDE